MPPKDPAAALLSTLSTEAALVESPVIELMATLGWSTANLLQETPGPANPTGRLSLKAPFLPARLSAALRKINPNLPQDAIQQAIDLLTQDRTVMLPIAANRAVAWLLLDGVPVQVKQSDGTQTDERVWLIDWRNPQANDFLLASQVWVHSTAVQR